jgi:ribose/xylose/arabinose/galactoside ABC-type transport system permease subunit
VKTPPQFSFFSSPAKAHSGRDGSRSRRSQSVSIFYRYGTEITLAAILLFLCVGLSVATPVFLTAENLSNLVKQSAINGIIALGMTIVIITGGIDLSVGSVAGFASAVGALLMTSGVAPIFAVPAALAVSFGIGLFNAFMVHEGGIAPFIATLGSMTMVRGLLDLVTGAQTIVGLPASFLKFGDADYFGIPSEFVLWMILTFVLTIVLAKTRFGRNIYAIGSSQEVARLSGISLRFNLYLAYGLCGLMAGIGGVVLAARVRMAAPTAGTGYELYAIAAAVVGGASLNGAQGTVIGSVLGALIMTTISSGGNLLGIDAFTLQIAVGALIVIAVWIDKVRKGKSKG